MVITSNQILIIRELFSKPLSPMSVSELRGKDIGLSEWRKESEELLHKGILVRTKNKYVLGFYHQETREALLLIHNQLFKEHKLHSTWKKDFSALARSALFSLAIPQKNHRLQIIIVTHQQHKKAVHKFCLDYQLASEQIFTPIILSLEEFLQGCTIQGIVSEALQSGVILFGNKELCDVVS